MILMLANLMIYGFFIAGAVLAIKVVYDCLKAIWELFL